MSSTTAPSTDPTDAPTDLPPHAARAAAGIALVLIGIVAFKGIVHFELGAAGYDARVAQLAAGSTVERVGAWIMQADPLTLWVSEQARNLVQ